jgi:flagellar hook-basal body complex protein FliE
MIESAANNLSKIAGPTGGISAGATPAGGTAASGETSFADMLSKNIDEVSRLQQDASKAVEDAATGQTQNVTGVMTAVEKSDLAFKTLLSIRAKLMDAYEEIKGISI